MRDIGQIELFNEIFRNNKTLCLEQAQAHFQFFVSLILNYGRQVKYLEFFLTVIKVGNEYLPNNQKTILNLLMDPKNRMHLFYLKLRDKSSLRYVKYEFDFTPINGTEADHNYMD